MQGELSFKNINEKKICSTLNSTYKGISYCGIANAKANVQDPENWNQILIK